MQLNPASEIKPGSGTQLVHCAVPGWVSLLCVTFSLSSFFPLCSFLCSPVLMAGHCHHYQLLNLHAADLPPGGCLTFSLTALAWPVLLRASKKQPSLRRAGRHFLQVEQRRKGVAAGLSVGAQGTVGRLQRVRCIRGRRQKMMQCSASLGEGSMACMAMYGRQGRVLGHFCVSALSIVSGS